MAVVRERPRENKKRRDRKGQRAGERAYLGQGRERDDLTAPRPQVE